MNYRFFIQSIWFHLNNGLYIEGDLTSYEGPFGATITFPFEDNHNWRVRTELPLPVSTAEQSFLWLLETVLIYANNREIRLEKIDNPTNDPFMSRSAQTNLLAQQGLKIPVLVKGL